jgi:glycosyltransferase involved in cell wall biosynthesis
MRVLMVTPRYLPHLGGVETHVRETARRLSSTMDVSILTTDPTRTEHGEDSIDGLRVTRVKAYPRNRDWLLAPGVWGACGKTDADLIHFQSAATAVPVLGMLAAIVNGKPFVLTFHTGGHTSALRNRLRPLQWRALRPLMAKAEALVAVSQSEVELFAEAMAVDKASFEVIQNGSDLPVPDQRSSFLPPDAFPVIVSIGRLERYKGHHRLIQAMPTLLRRHPRALLVIGGQGAYGAALEDLIDEAGLRASVKMVAFGPAERQDLANLVGSADVAALLSEYEAHPVAVMEALAVGTPVLGSNNSGFLELLEGGLIDAISVDAGPAEIAVALERVARRPRGQHQMRSWDDCASDVGALYGRLVASPRT